MDVALRDAGCMDGRAEHTKFHGRRDPGAGADLHDMSTSRQPVTCGNIMRRGGSSVASSAGSSGSSRCESPLQDQEVHLQASYQSPSYHPNHQEHQDSEGLQGLKQQQQQQEQQQQQQEKPQQQPQQQQQPGVFIRGADRRALQNLRVIRRTLVYAIGLSPNFAQVNTLKQPEYFGQYGDIAKLVINHHQGVPQDDPRHGSASAYVTFRRQEDAWAAICSVDGFRLMGRTIRASFGTTKYCNSFLRNLPCNNPDCLYLHELGDEGDRFTKDEVQLGLARHGSSFAFKEEVLRERVSNARRPANPVFPPPCAMPPASYQRDGFKHQQQGGCGGDLRHSVNTGGGGGGVNGPPCGGGSGHTPLLPPASARACQSCGNRSGGGGGGGCYFGAADARWADSPMASRSPLPLDGPSPGGSEERSRPRRRRGQRGRRGAGNRAEAARHGDGCGHDPSADAGGSARGGGGGSAVVASPYSAVSPVASLEQRGGYEFGGSGCGVGVGGCGNGGVSGNTYPRPFPPSETHSVGSNLSVGSRSGSTCGVGGGGGGARGSGGGGNTWGKWRESSCAATSETLSVTPPSALSPVDRLSPVAPPSFFHGLGSSNENGGATPPAQDVWNRSQYQHPARPVPKFLGLNDDGTSQRDVANRRQPHTSRQQQQQQQQQHLFMAGVGGMRGTEVFSEVRPDLNLLHLDQQQQQQHRNYHHHHHNQRLHFPREQDGGIAAGAIGGNEHASIAALQLQVDKLQRYLDHSALSAGVGDRGVGANFSPLPPPSLGRVSDGGGGGGGGDTPAGKSFAGDLSFAQDRLASLSWDDADAFPAGRGGGNGNANALAQHQYSQPGGGGGFAGDSTDVEVEGRWAGADSAWAAAPSPLSGLGSLSLPAAVSQAEFSQWRRATPGLLT